jgi:hypothetical protein
MAINCESFSVVRPVCYIVWFSPCAEGGESSGVFAVKRCCFNRVDYFLFKRGFLAVESLL